ncbi:MAG: hypothetical protein IH861_08025, partial [Chloroflexi bacterium]|nr:hypothetical protein [Chloroflexota bacterium]
MKRSKIAAAILMLVAVGVSCTFLGGDRSDGRETSQDSPFSTSRSAPPSTATPEEAASNTELDGLPSARLGAMAFGEFDDDSGPFLVSSNAMVDVALPSHQKRVFRAPDGTIAVLYHRVHPKSRELSEIVLTHSHDGGRTWEGEVTVSSEAAQATYSGIADADGNIFVAYGSHASESRGGAIKGRKLSYIEELHAWTLGPEQTVLLDWPGRGASFPVLAFTGTRLWLAYRYYDGNGYFISVQYADAGDSDDYLESSWSSPLQVSPTSRGQGVYALLVPHDTRLSIFFAQQNDGGGGGQSGIIWRMLDDPQRQPNGWEEASVLFRSDIGGQETAFSAIADDRGNVHLVAGKQGLFSAYLRYDGSDWSRPTQLAVNSIYSVSLARDGEEAWALWNKVDPNGSSRIIARRWQPDRGWVRTAESPWREQFGVELPSVLWYRSENGSYSDITRYATVSGGAGPATVVSKFLRRGEDAIYVRDDSKFNYVPFKLVSVDSVDPDISFEYWDGSQWSPLIMAPELINGVGGPLVSDVGFVPPQDWQPTQVNGDSGFFVRLRRDGLRPTVSNMLRIASSQRVFGPLANSSIAGVVDVLWSESNQDSDRGRLWYGVVSPDGTYPTAGTPEHEHKVEPVVLRGLSNSSDRPAPLPSGSPRQYTQVSLDTEKTHVYQLLDGQFRYVKVLETELVEQSRKGVTIWATATVEVSGPGLEPETAV